MIGREEFVVADDGGRLWTWTTGTGPAMALAHGGPGHWSQLEPVAEMLADGFTVHLWDQRGAGRSSPVGPFTVARTGARSTTPSPAPASFPTSVTVSLGPSTRNFSVPH